MILPQLMTLPTLSLYLLEAHAEPAGMWDTILHSNLINILLVVILLVWVAKKQNLPAGLDAQRQTIAGDLMAAEQRRKEAQARLDKIEQQTARLQVEVQDILSNARQSAESMSNQMLSDAKVEADRIVENAKKRVEMEQRGALNDLQSRLLGEAVADARQELVNSLTVADQKRSVDSFIDELSTMKGAR